MYISVCPFVCVHIYAECSPRACFEGWSLEGVGRVYGKATPLAKKLPDSHAFLALGHLKLQQSQTNNVGGGIIFISHALYVPHTLVAITNLFQSVLLAQRPPLLNSTF